MHFHRTNDVFWGPNDHNHPQNHVTFKNLNLLQGNLNRNFSEAKPATWLVLKVSQPCLSDYLAWLSTRYGSDKRDYPHLTLNSSICKWGIIVLQRAPKHILLFSLAHLHHKPSRQGTQWWQNGPIYTKYIWTGCTELGDQLSALIVFCQPKNTF